MEKNNLICPLIFNEIRDFNYFFFFFFLYTIETNQKDFYHPFASGCVDSAPLGTRAQLSTPSPSLSTLPMWTGELGNRETERMSQKWTREGWSIQPESQSDWSVAQITICKEV